MKAVVCFSMGAFFPASDTLPALQDMGLAEYVDNMRNDTSTMYWLGVVLSGWAYVWCPLVTIGVPLPAFLLSARLRDKHTMKMATSNLYLVRQAAYLLRLSAGMLWGADPRVRAHFQLPAYAPDPGTFRT